MWPPCRLLRGAAQKETLVSMAGARWLSNDTPNVLQVVADNLTEGGAKVTAVGSAEEALAALQWERPAVPIRHDHPRLG